MIVTSTEKTIVFVEVKSSRTNNAGSPESWVNPRKIKTIQRVAQQYVKENKLYNVSMQFDVIGIDLSVKPVKINHIPNAFLPDSRYYY